jgi:hypothetical protein
VDLSLFSCLASGWFRVDLLLTFGTSPLLGRESVRGSQGDYEQVLEAPILGRENIRASLVVHQPVPETSTPGKQPDRKESETREFSLGRHEGPSGGLRAGGLSKLYLSRLCSC